MAFIYVLVTSALLVAQSLGFTVVPREPELTVVQTDDASFHYGISPWPPPYHDPALDAKYEHVTLTFQDGTLGGLPVPLCVVEYVKGVYDEETGNCTLWNERMYPFDPIPTTGVYFAFSDANYTTDRGEYILQIEYGAPTITNVTELHILVPTPAPDITATPGGEVEIGTNVTLHCRVNRAEPGASLRWTRGQWEDVPVEDGNFYQAQSYEEYSVSTIWLITQQSDHGAVYICYAHNDVPGSAERTTSHAITVTYDPSVQLYPCNADGSAAYRVEEGKDATFDCNIDANPDVHTIEWYRALEGEEMTKVPDYNATWYTLTKVSREQQGSMKCTGESARASDSATCAMEVIYGPEVTIPDETVLEAEGETLLYTCTSEANPAAHHYQWRREDHPNFLQDGALLNLTKVSVDEAGSYICEATNTLKPTGHNEEERTGLKHMQVHVKFAPVIAQYAMTKFAGRENEAATLVCEVEGYPYVDLEWRKDDTKLESNEQRNISQHESTGYLQIHSVVDSDFGAYECRTSNEKGSLNVALSLLLPGEPDHPQYCEVSDVSDSEVIFICVPGYDGGEEISSNVEIEKKSGGRKKTDSVSTITEDGLMRVLVQGMDSDTEYYVHIYAQNKHGRSDNAYKAEATTEEGPGDGTGSGGGAESPNIGLIVGGTVVGLVLLAVLVTVGLVVLWKYGIEPACSLEAQKRTVSYYENLPFRSSAAMDSLPRESSTDEGAAYDNKAFKNDNGAVRRSGTNAGNEYVSMPGMVKRQRPVSEHDIYLTDNRVNQAHMQRRAQNNLAGAGAMTHGSQQNIHMLPSNTPRDSDVRPRLRPAPIGGSAEDVAWEIPRDAIRLNKKLGEGAFGEVWRGTAHDIGGRDGKTTVAVKFISDPNADEERMALVKELQLMKSLDSHPNLIKLYGCCSAVEPMYIVMEFASNGNLQDFLRQHRSPGKRPHLQHVSRTLSSRDLTIFALHVASGMEFISVKRYLHRDLAARNVLVDDTMTCKIGDFGLSRDIINCRQYESTRQRRLPIRWMAPESLFDSVYTTKSDVWAFGVLLWEIVTLGATPYLAMSGPEIAEMLQMGYRMDKPKHCSHAMYALMQECWKQEPQMRPGFSNIRHSLEAVLHDIDHNPYSDISVTHMTDNMLGIVSGAPGEKC